MPFFHLGLRLNLRHIGLTLAAVGVLNLVPREAGAQGPTVTNPVLIPTRSHPTVSTSVPKAVPSMKPSARSLTQRGVSILSILCKRLSVSRLPSPPFSTL